jgi:TonB family protein
MFDKLIESDTAGAEFKNRSRYFLVSSVVVGILFLTAVVYSLYAGEIGLGDQNFDIAELQAPIEIVEPESPQPREPVSSDRTATSPNRNSDMARTDESTIAPTSTSSAPNPQLSRTWKPFNPNLPETPGIVSPPGGILSGRPGGSGSNPKANFDEEEGVSKVDQPPPVTTVERKAKTIRVSEVLNGSAVSLPRPAYPRTAIALNLEGVVNVQVTIDENGSVVSARAIDGHMFFRQVAEQAARRAKFNPTKLNKVPVKVTGVIAYRFKLN